MHFFFPEGYSPQREEPYPAIVNFCGGGWVEMKMEWAQGNSRFMADQGFIGIAAQYRVADYSKLSSFDSMLDAHSAVRWVRTYGDEFNIDSDRIIAMGDSAGGHLALNTAMCPHYNVSPGLPPIFMTQCTDDEILPLTITLSCQDNELILTTRILAFSAPLFFIPFGVFRGHSTRL